MRKEIIYCDDCGREMKNEYLKLSESDASLEFCQSCVLERTLYSLTAVAYGRKCKLCRGRGQIKEFFCYHNDYNWVQCPLCHGNTYLTLEQCIK